MKQPRQVSPHSFEKFHARTEAYMVSRWLISTTSVLVIKYLRDVKMNVEYLSIAVGNRSLGGRMECRSACSPIELLVTKSSPTTFPRSRSNS